MPEDDCWPSVDQWNALNDTIGGRLTKGIPPASVCYPEEPNYNPQACQTIFENWSSSAWHAADPVSVDAPDVSRGCYPLYGNGTNVLGDSSAGSRGCTASGWFSAFVINATEVSHVQEGVRFAGEHNLRLNVKNTGHNTNSEAPGSLSVWTHHFKSMDFSKTWLPQGCDLSVGDSRMAMTFGAGVQDREAFEAAAEHDAVVVGGTDSTVGLVGWSIGGGHGYLTGSYGMGADNILEANVVTMDGGVVTVNECQNRDLFWAIRGGGPSFGVLTSLTMKAYPMPNATMWSIDVAASNGTTDLEWWKVVAGFHSYLPALKQAGFQGYITLNGPPMALGAAIFAYNTSSSHASATIAPLRSYLQSQGNAVSSSVALNPVPRWIDVYHMFNLTLAAGGGAGAVTSRLISAQALTEDLDILANVFGEIGPSSNRTSKHISQKSISCSFVASPDPVDNALNPAWRDTVVHLRVSNSWSMETPHGEAESATLDMTEATGRALRLLEPDSGVYFNEADPNEPDWQCNLFGENYPRLLAIKEKYDPEGILWSHHCVGSENWNIEEDGRVCPQGRS
ncbi:hypothetical protein PRZ48_006118 [Zasmidium cellare]|uniref:FAD-binding PCMH-type domain-containing protein n=1 Tax=Zasmidium cellare TaxID=395010 RepID=A0ABR0EMH1_ZASCE|nr:hypothetical protein PRZ48_006118 [Zasmidium cellare]